MPPRTVFGREAVVDAGFQVLRSKGLNRLTARNVAEQLGSSVAPLYCSFDSMQAFENAVIGRVKDLLLEYTARPHTELIFLNMGVGIATFARDEPQLFRSLFLERGDFKQAIDELLASLCRRMTHSSNFASWSYDERMALLMKMWIYTHGLASLIAVGVLNDTSDDYIISSIKSVGAVVSRAAIEDHERIIQERSHP